jgi:transcriptional regulator with XRE-family HTH domain
MREKKVAGLLGRRIRTLRKSKNLTQEQLGGRAGINYKHLGAIERGDENPSLSVLDKIADGLGVEILELFRFQHEETDPVKLRKMMADLVKDEKVDRLQLILNIINATR